MRKSGTLLDQFNSWRYALRPKPNNNDSNSSENSSKKGNNYTGSELEFFFIAYRIKHNFFIVPKTLEYGTQLSIFDEDFLNVPKMAFQFFVKFYFL